MFLYKLPANSVLQEETMSTNSSIDWQRREWVLLSFILGGLLFVGLVLAAPVSADDFVVNSVLDSPGGNLGDGGCEDGPCNCTRRAAI